MPKGKTIGLIFVEGFADWEFGILSAAMGGGEEWFDGRVFALSPEGKAVRSIAGLTLAPERGTDPEDNQDLEGIAVIGSDVWLQAAPDVTPLLASVARRGGVVGGICAGTLALARAGLFAKAVHTSNSREYIAEYVPDYDGQKNYRYLPHAIGDGKIVSAPGTAPLTFAAEFVRALHPEQSDRVAEMTTIFAKEHRR